MNRRRFVRSLVGAGWAVLPVGPLAGCGYNEGATATAQTAATAAVGRATAPGQARANTEIAGIPQRGPDRQVGANTDGWYLDRIETGQRGGFATFTIICVPPPDETSIPQTDAWFEETTEQYILQLHGIRGATPNFTLRADVVEMVNVRPLVGYYAPSLRSAADDGIYLLVLSATNVRRAGWSLASGTKPGVVIFSVSQS